MKLNEKSAVAAINQAGILLVFPMNNKKEPASLWSHFFPGKKMKWEWHSADESGLTDLWNLKTQLSTTRKVVYTKWYQDKATYFSRELFTAMLRILNPEIDAHSKLNLSKTALSILEILKSDSPISTKELKKMVLANGRDTTSSFEKAMKELWSKLLVVAFGEVADGSFPSLAVGATETLFEDLWAQAKKMSVKKAMTTMENYLPPESLVRKHFFKVSTN